jgi:hypothetical protein
MILFYIAHLHAEQLQSVHEHAEPQLVFSSMKMEKKRFWSIKYFICTYEHMIYNHIYMNNYHHICRIHLDIQHHIHILQLNNRTSWKNKW